MSGSTPGGHISISMPAEPPPDAEKDALRDLERSSARWTRQSSLRGGRKHSRQSSIETRGASPQVSRPATPTRLIRGRFSAAGGAVHFVDQPESRSQSRVRPSIASIPVTALSPGKSEREAEASKAGRGDSLSESTSRHTLVNQNSKAAEEARHTPRDDYHDVYPPDELGDETSSHARVWRIYVDEALKVDAATVDGWNRSIDVLLVFAGLFSAVLTTFIIQAYTLLVPDSTDLTNFLLSEMLALQRNVSLGVSPNFNPPLLPFSPSMKARWVNGLWFISLVCSLSAALISMLVKQWLQGLQSYGPSSSGTPRDRARLRQYRQMGLESWHVPELISALPLLLHIALLLFFAGLVVLLWSLDIGITTATLIIVAAVYMFYVISTILPLIYPDCPYQTPVAHHLAKLLKLPACNPWTWPLVLSEHGFTFHRVNGLQPQSTSSIEDVVDAKALCWLFETSADSTIVSTALQALSGLRRDFTAAHVFQEAGASRLIEEGFVSCFQPQDRAVGADWVPTDPAGAELFCRAWMNVMRDANEQWPLDIVQPLWALQERKAPSDAAAIASCAVALSSFDSLASQWELLSYLGQAASGAIQLAPCTQRWLLDSVSECVVRWEVPAAVVEQTSIRAVPVLLRLLHLYGQDGASHETRYAAALALRLHTCGPIAIAEFQLYRSEDKRREDFRHMILRALSAIVDSPSRFGVDDAALDIVVDYLGRLSSQVVAESERLPHDLRLMTRTSLSRLFLAGKLSVDAGNEAIMADVLQLLFPPRQLSEADQCRFIGSLVGVLKASVHPGVLSWAVRLLEELFKYCGMSACVTFANEDGISAVLLRACKTDDPAEVHRLQVDSLRALCTFAHRCSLELSEDEKEGQKLLDFIFESDLFETICQVVTSRRSWLFEASAHWIPTLKQLCQLRPREGVWAAVITTFVDYAERNDEEEGYLDATNHLEEMKKLTNVDSTSL